MFEYGCRKVVRNTIHHTHDFVSDFVWPDVRPIVSVGNCTSTTPPYSLASGLLLEDGGSYPLSYAKHDPEPWLESPERSTDLARHLNPLHSSSVQQNPSQEEFHRTLFRAERTTPDAARQSSCGR